MYKSNKRFLMLEQKYHKMLRDDHIIIKIQLKLRARSPGLEILRRITTS